MIVFIEKRNTCKGGAYASVSVRSKSDFIKGLVRKSRCDISYGEIDGTSSTAICSMNLEEFKRIFNNEEIEDMRKNGVLNYRPNGVCLKRKFPYFRKDIYVKYGVEEV